MKYLLGAFAITWIVLICYILLLLRRRVKLAKKLERIEGEKIEKKK
ncbi:MAG: CcmD family protein [Methanocellales archaeon]|nr:CcmD family protein [Methanocellales archaeon]